MQAAALSSGGQSARVAIPPSDRGLYNSSLTPVHRVAKPPDGSLATRRKVNLDSSREIPSGSTRKGILFQANALLSKGFRGIDPAREHRTGLFPNGA
jgi:hypothetical protein